MNISFDLDGVVADTDRWVFRLLNIFGSLHTIDKELLDIMELDYYSSRSLKHHPQSFMSYEDKGFIITSRRPISKVTTQAWLDKYHVLLPIIYSDNGGDIDWTNYEKASLIAGEYKAEVIKEFSIDVHFDNNPYIVGAVRKLLPTVKTILVGE